MATLYTALNSLAASSNGPRLFPWWLGVLNRRTAHLHSIRFFSLASALYPAVGRISHTWERQKDAGCCSKLCSSAKRHWDSICCTVAYTCAVIACLWWWRVFSSKYLSNKINSYRYHFVWIGYQFLPPFCAVLLFCVVQSTPTFWVRRRAERVRLQLNLAHSFI